MNPDEISGAVDIYLDLAGQSISTTVGNNTSPPVGPSSTFAGTYVPPTAVVDQGPITSTSSAPQPEISDYHREYIESISRMVRQFTYNTSNISIDFRLLANDGVLEEVYTPQPDKYRWTGEWSDVKDYELDDVIFKTYFYVCVKNHNCVHPQSNKRAEYWKSVSHDEIVILLNKLSSSNNLVSNKDFVEPEKRAVKL